MSIAQALLSEFDHEMAVTRKVLERVPEADAAWKPHQKSFSMGDLAAHVANLVHWTVSTLKQNELDLNPPGGPGWTSPKFESTAKLLAIFDANVKAAREAIAGTSDAAMMEPWTLKNGGVAIFTQPRVGVLRGFVFSHGIHHRGQLSVYLRLRDVPVPSIYGPSADSPM
jgi:uncharacterized damage-inducible protein DinB